MKKIALYSKDIQDTMSNIVMEKVVVQNILGIGNSVLERR